MNRMHTQTSYAPDEGRLHGPPGPPYTARLGLRDRARDLRNSGGTGE